LKPDTVINDGLSEIQSSVHHLKNSSDLIGRYQAAAFSSEVIDRQSYKAL
jgi:tetrahydromethanopterin S-methyltransferase subunit F